MRPAQFNNPGSADPDTLPHAHTTCGKRWSGANTSHCRAGCCRTFTGVGPFDAHRVKGECLPPQSVGLVLAEGRAYEAWGKANTGD